MTSKEFYRNYRADIQLFDLNYMLAGEILEHTPSSVFEFGCGSGKNLRLLKELSPVPVETYGIDISLINCIQAHILGIDSITCGDERHLRAVNPKFDVVFTCSVLDHIPDIGNIINAFHGMASKAIILAETNSLTDNFYYQHEYSRFGFHTTAYTFHSKQDGATYQIYRKVL